jgi:glucosamine kinase
MIIIADSGSTKTTWSVFNQKILIKEIATEGYNPYYSTLDDIVNSMKSNLDGQISFDQVTHIFFYGAGCDGIKKNIVLKALQTVFGNAEIDVQSDMMATSRSIVGYGAGLVCILGTGTNSCLVDKDKITYQVSSLGFLLGDEGSGAYIGKKLLILYARKALPEELMQAFFTAYKIKPEEILNVFYDEPLQNRFAASFTVFVGTHIAHPSIAKIVRGAFVDFFENIISNYPAYKIFSFNCVGSIGYIFKDILTEVVTAYGMTVGKIVKSPMENLCDFHLENLTKV